MHKPTVANTNKIWNEKARVENGCDTIERGFRDEVSDDKGYGIQSESRRECVLSIQMLLDGEEC